MITEEKVKRLQDSMTVGQKEELVNKLSSILESDVKSCQILFFARDRFSGAPDEAVFLTGENERIDEILRLALSWFQ